MYRTPVAQFIFAITLCCPLAAQSVSEKPPTISRAPNGPPATAPSEQQPPAANESKFAVFHLQYLSVKTAIAAIEKFHPGSNLIVDGDMHTNQLWVRGDNESLERIQTFIQALDQAAAVNPAASTSSFEYIERAGIQDDGARAKPMDRVLQKDGFTLRQERQRALDPSILQQEKKSIEFALQVRKGEKDRAELREAVAEAFRMKQDAQRSELQSLQQRIESLRRHCEAREKNADQIITQRVDELLNPDLQWQAQLPRDNTVDSWAAKSSVTIRLSPDGKALQLESASQSELQSVEAALRQLSGKSKDKSAAVQIESVPELDLVIVRGEKSAVQDAMNVINKIKATEVDSLSVERK